MSVCLPPALQTCQYHPLHPLPDSTWQHRGSVCAQPFSWPLDLVSDDTRQPEGQSILNLWGTGVRSLGPSSLTHGNCSTPTQISSYIAAYRQLTFCQSSIVGNAAYTFSLLYVCLSVFHFWSVITAALNSVLPVPHPHCLPRQLSSAMPWNLSLPFSEPCLCHHCAVGLFFSPQEGGPRHGEILHPDLLLALFPTTCLEGQLI